ncbi:MAG: hypothetical protein R3B95_08420 [Nitrospirales bacterium]
MARGLPHTVPYEYLPTELRYHVVDAGVLTGEDRSITRHRRA